MTVLRDLRDRAATRSAHIVLSEGTDPRVVEAAVTATRERLARITLVGDTDAVKAALTAAGADPTSFDIQDPATSALTKALESTYLDIRGAKGATADIAARQLQDPLVFAALMVRDGHADGTVGGAVYTTSDTVRAALQMIGKAQGAALVSSFFLMVLPEGHPTGRDAMIFSDCGLVIDPSAPELAAIAAQSAASFANLLNDTPKIAMLSFSTKGSAKHPSVTKVTEATALLQQARPDLISDGELQFDAAFVPSVAASKAPGSPLEGAANVLIFPNLDAGNIGYKLAQRLGGASAIGPVLQGLAKPANDLSRGCVAEDVLNMIAVTALQVAKP